MDVAIWSEFCGDLSRNVAIWRILKNPYVSQFEIAIPFFDFKNLRKFEIENAEKKTVPFVYTISDFNQNLETENSEKKQLPFVYTITYLLSHGAFFALKLCQHAFEARS